jgi:myo-inositol-1(or 4)-monophosphatase
MRFGEPVFGMMHQPFTRERFTGDGGPAQNGGRIVAASDRRVHAAALEMLKG